ncbi:heparinase II/III family protein [bacterium AH-315-E10]|nr:heparinase II/III family protein [bacterium AH-315-E10]
MTLSITPINDAEAVIARFYDPLRKQIDSWQYDINPDHPGNRINSSWSAIQCNWVQGTPVRMKMSREVDLDVSDFSHLSLCLQSSSSTHVSVHAVIDGQDHIVIDQAVGIDSGQELEGSLNGSRISRLDIIIEDSAESAGLVTLFWMGVFHEKRRQKLRSRIEYYRDGWGDLMLPPDEVVENPEPQLGLHFDTGELDALRRKAASPVWAPIMEQLRVEAKSHLKDEPWRGVGPTWNNFVIRDGRMENNTLWIDWTAMRLCAFVGLLDNDPALMRMAVNHALAAAHCDVWHPSFMYSMPGSGTETRAFFEYRTAINSIFAWDWAGSYLTDAGRTVLAQAISIKGLPWSQQTLMRHKYVRNCNQGVFFAYGSIVCQLALSKIWPHGNENLEVAIRALDETMTRYYAEDGGTFEGIGYATGTLAQALAAYAIIAREKGVEINNIMPPVVPRISHYIETMLSTQMPYGAIIKTADGGRAGACVISSAIGILSLLNPDTAMPALLAGLNTQAVKNGYFLGDELNIIFGPETLPEPSSKPPVFKILKQTGMLCSCRPTPDGPVRLQLIGGPAGAGHCHDDRGSFVLEAFTEEIAIDRGQMPYNDPRCSTIKNAEYHNVLTPDTDDGSFIRQANPCPEASIPEGDGNENTLNCRINASAAYGEMASHWLRTIESDEPAKFTIIDEMDLVTPGTVTFHVHSLFPWEQTTEGWVTRGHKAELKVTPDWQPVEAWGKEDFVDGEKNPAYHLALRAPKSSQHRLKTELTVKPIT